MADVVRSGALFEQFLSRFRRQQVVRFWLEAAFSPFSAHNLGEPGYGTPYCGGSGLSGGANR